MKKLNLPFGWKLYVLNCNTEELNNQTKKLGLNFKFKKEDKIAGIAEFIYREKPKDSFFIVWVNNEEKDNFYHLLHEIHHIALLYSEHLEIKDEEFKAYLFEDIYKQLNLRDLKDERRRF